MPDAFLGGGLVDWQCQKPQLSAGYVQGVTEAVCHPDLISLGKASKGPLLRHRMRAGLGCYGHQGFL